jgi:4-hydroxyphenylpyruvate dioxygenase
MSLSQTTDAAPAELASAAPGGDDAPILGIDHIELYVGNARQTAMTFQRLGFTVQAHAGLLTGHRDRSSWVLRQGEVVLVVTGALDADSPIAEHVHRHGDGVRDVALRVPDATAAFERAVRAGAEPVAEPAARSDDAGEVVTASVGAYGDVRHTFVQRDGYRGAFLPGFRARQDGQDAPLAAPAGVARVDHVVAAVPVGESERLVEFYREVLGFRQLHYFDDTSISTEYSALMNKVMADGSGRIKIPIVEPGRSAKRGQVQEFLDYHRGPGVQHIALETPDIVATVEELGRRGLEFLGTPATYYDELPARVAEVSDRIAKLRTTSILADKDDEGYLLQIFARSLNDRPTLFLEFIERHGAIGLGEGNIRALYEALERDQQARGNL